MRGLADLEGGAMEGALDSEPGTGGLLSRPSMGFSALGLSSLLPSTLSEQPRRC